MVTSWNGNGMGSVDSQSKVSVIIPTYNRADVLEAAVASVLAQTHSNLELCIVDDGSTDGTPELLRTIAERDSRVIIETHSPNQGACAALNSGIRATTGELIAFLDTDDVWLPQKLEKQVERLSVADAGRAVAVGCGWELMDGRPGRVPLARAATSKEILRGAPGSGGPTLLVRRLDDQPYWDEDLSSMQDRVFLIDYSRHGDVVFVPEVLLRVGRGRSDHITKPRATMRAYLDIMRLFDEELGQDPELLAHYHVRIAREALILRERKLAFDQFAQARRLVKLRPGSYIEWLLGFFFGYRGLAAYTRLRGAHGYA